MASTVRLGRSYGVAWFFQVRRLAESDLSPAASRRQVTKVQ